MAEYQNPGTAPLHDRIESLDEHSGSSTIEVQTLLDELQAHQIVLEMQIQELREAHQKLEEARDRYADLYHFAPVGYLTLDEKGRLREINLTGAAMLGKERTHLLGYPLATWVVDDKKPLLLDHLRQVFSRPGNVVTELKISCSDNAIREVRLESAVRENAADNLRTCHTVMLDITDQKRMAGIIQEKQSMQEALLSTTPAAVYFKDKNLRYLGVSKVCAGMMGWLESEIIGKTDYELCPPEIAEEYQHSDRAVLESGHPILNLEQHINDLHGNEFWVSTSKAPYIGEDGEIAGLVGISTDITPFKTAEKRGIALLQENRRLTRRMFNVQEAERRYLARELHDELGQWLTAIQAEAEAICRSRDVDREPKIHAGIHAILESAGEVHKVIRRILRELRPVLLDELGLADSLKELVAQWQKHYPDITWKLSLNGDLGQLNEMINITLYRIVQEALTNAAKYSAASRVSIVLQRDTAQENGYDKLRLVVEDNGKGIAQPILNNGFGVLGMRERAIAAEGELSIRSDTGAGVRIEVSLPVIAERRGNEVKRDEF